MANSPMNLHGMKHVMLYDGNKKQGTIDLGNYQPEDFDMILFIVKANSDTDTFEDIWFPKISGTTYMQFSHGVGYLGAYTVNGGNHCIGFAHHENNVNWSLGVIKCIGIYFE